MLTDAALRNLKPKSKIYKASDRDGMYVTVSPGGTVTFRYDYRLNGRRETLTLGRYGPGGISLAMARELLLDARKAVLNRNTSASATTRPSFTTSIACRSPKNSIDFPPTTPSCRRRCRNWGRRCRATSDQPSSSRSRRWWPATRRLARMRRRPNATRCARRRKRRQVRRCSSGPAINAPLPLHLSRRPLQSRRHPA